MLRRAPSAFAMLAPTMLTSSSPVTAKHRSALSTSAWNRTVLCEALPSIARTSSSLFKRRTFSGSLSTTVTLWRRRHSMSATQRPTVPPPSVKTRMRFLSNSNQPTNEQQHDKNQTHEPGDPACGVQRMLENQAGVFVPRCAEDQRNRDQ